MFDIKVLQIEKFVFYFAWNDQPTLDEAIRVDRLQEMMISVLICKLHPWVLKLSSV